jgi:hypothetical protein
MRTIAAFGMIAFLISPAFSQEAISCEGWTQANGQPLKIVSEIKDWIVRTMRDEGRALATQSVKDGTPLSDLRSATDNDLLTEVSNWCQENPGDLLGNATDDAAFALAAVQKAPKNSN